MAGALRRTGGGELEREDYLALKLPGLPSIDSAVESWVSSGPGSASSSNGSSNNNENSHQTTLNADSPVIYTAGGMFFSLESIFIKLVYSFSIVNLMY